MPLFLLWPKDSTDSRDSTISATIPQAAVTYLGPRHTPRRREGCGVGAPPEPPRAGRAPPPAASAGKGTPGLWLVTDVPILPPPRLSNHACSPFTSARTVAALSAWSPAHPPCAAAVAG